MIQLYPPFFEHAHRLLRNMAIARAGDLRENILVRQGRGSFQLSGAGHEAIAAIGLLFRDGDLCFPAYRDRALMHTLGMSVDEIARDFFSKADSSSGGRNLPGHFSSRQLGVFSITSPVGAQCLPAVGAAWSFKLEGSTSVAFCHIGDAATRQGEFFEAVAQAVQDRLPVVFVVEDNGYGISTPTSGTTARALGMLPPEIMVSVEGRSAEAVYLAGQNAVSRARGGDGPTVLWCEVDRLGNHTNADDHRTYRTVGAIAAMSDPVERLAASMILYGALDDEAWMALRNEVDVEVRESYARVALEEPPSAESVGHHLFGSLCDHPPLRRSKPSDTMLGSVNGTLREALATHPRVLIFGEDVEDPKGGVFGITKGLSDAFPGRVVNSPLAEATIVGTAVGLAAAGWKPVFELQFVDFVGPAFNQIVSQVTNLRWRTKGEWSCPLVIYAPYGAYLPGGGMWHSQSNEGLFAGLTGLRVAVPSTPEDAAGLLWSAIHGEDPSLVLLPKHLLRAETSSVANGDLAWGRGRIVCEGSDVTVVAWGNCVEIAVAAAEALAKEGLRIEVVDPRTLVPCDWDLILASIARTGRLVVVQEDSQTCGFGQAVVSEAATRAFEMLRSAPVLVARADIPVPFSSLLEAEILPDTSDLIRAIRSTLTEDDRLALVLDAEIVVDEVGLTLTVPQLGEGLRRVRVMGHLKKPGERIELDEPLYEIETDKAHVIVESPASGVLVEWLVDVGEEAEVHGPIARLDLDCPLAIPTPVVAPAEETYREFPVSERQRTMNRSAMGGRLDLPIPASVGRPLPWRLVEEARSRLRKIDPRLRLTEFGVFACAAARATRDHPKFRSTLVERGETVRRYDHVDVGFAIALPGDELTTAVIRDADALSFEEFGSEMRSRHREAKNGASQSDARTTLLISSLAGHDIIDAAPVLFPPAIATLFIGSPFEGSTEREANMRLAFDHRLINGVGAAIYLQAIEAELAAFGAKIGEPLPDSVESSTR